MDISNISTSSSALQPRTSNQAELSQTDTEETAGSASAGSPAASPAPKGGGSAVPIAAQTEEEIDLATLARVRSMVGAAEAENVINDDGSINYQKLAEVLAMQAAQAETTTERPTPVIDLVA